MKFIGEKNRQMERTARRIQKSAAVLLAAFLIGSAARPYPVKTAAAIHTSAVILDQTSYTLQKGKKLKLLAEVTDDSLQGQTIVWTSSKKEIVSVKRAGHSIHRNR